MLAEIFLLRCRAAVKPNWWIKGEGDVREGTASVYIFSLLICHFAKPSTSRAARIWLKISIGTYQLITTTEPTVDHRPLSNLATGGDGKLAPSSNVASNLHLDHVANALLFLDAFSPSAPTAWLHPAHFLCKLASCCFFNIQISSAANIHKPNPRQMATVAATAIEFPSRSIVDLLVDRLVLSESSEFVSRRLRVSRAKAIAFKHFPPSTPLIGRFALIFIMFFLWCSMQEKY